MMPDPSDSPYLDKEVLNKLKLASLVKSDNEKVSNVASSFFNSISQSKDTSIEVNDLINSDDPEAQAQLEKNKKSAKFH